LGLLDWLRRPERPQADSPPDREDELREPEDLDDADEEPDADEDPTVYPLW
jgi:hypothetical protein